jgi:uncharacterized protein (TIGR02145 family)
MNIIKSLLSVSIAVSACLAQINISGTVTDTGGIPIAGAFVLLEKAGLKDTTGPDGSFTLAGAFDDIGQSNQPLQKKLSAIIQNSRLCLNVVEKSAVEIVTCNLQGKVLFTVQKTMDAGTHSIALPHLGAGVYFYTIKSGGSEFTIKSPSISRVSVGTIVSVHNSPSTVSARHAMSSDAINDVIAVTKAGYLNYRVAVTNSDTSGIKIEMLVCETTVVDVDGNVYQAVRIGIQVWTVENLRTTQFNDTTPIAHVPGDDEWAGLNTAGYCYYNNTTDVNYIKKYGALYNWYAVDTDKLAPKGWHVPTEAEWFTLENYLIMNGYNWDSTTMENRTAKSLAARTDWRTSTVNGATGNDLTKNNRTGFSGLPVGYRSGNYGFFYYTGVYGYLWSFAENDDDIPQYRCLHYDYDTFFRRDNFNRRVGFSVRLVKD